MFYLCIPLIPYLRVSLETVSWGRCGPRDVTSLRECPPWGKSEGQVPEKARGGKLSFVAVQRQYVEGLRTSHLLCKVCQILSNGKAEIRDTSEGSNALNPYLILVY